MLTLGIRYLCGWAMATHPADYESAEWPPHPDRVFMALAAAHFETGGLQSERAALEWLEKLPAPTMAAPHATQRNVVTVFAIPRPRVGLTSSRRSSVPETPATARDDTNAFPIA